MPVLEKNHIMLRDRIVSSDVYIDGKKLDPGPSLQLFNHSPDGFSWGYSGSGPAQLALAILLEVTGDATLAVRLHQRFKEEFVAAWPQADYDEWIDVAGWAKTQAVES